MKTITVNCTHADGVDAADSETCQSKAILTPNVQRWRDTSKLQSTF